MCEYIQGYIPSKDDAAKLESFDVTLSGFRKLMEFPAKLAGAISCDSLPTEAKLIDFLDSINYNWEKSNIVSVVKRGRMSSKFSYLFADFIQ